MNKLREEPVLTAAAITPLIIALFAVLRSFGVNITAEQQTAITALVGIILPFVTAYIARNLVTTVANPKDNDGRPLIPDTDLLEYEADIEPA